MTCCVTSLLSIQNFGMAKWYMCVPIRMVYIGLGWFVFKVPPPPLPLVSRCFRAPRNPCIWSETINNTSSTAHSIGSHPSCLYFQVYILASQCIPALTSAYQQSTVHIFAIHCIPALTSAYLLSSVHIFAIQCIPALTSAYLRYPMHICTH